VAHLFERFYLKWNLCTKSFGTLNVSFVLGLLFVWHLFLVFVSDGFGEVQFQQGVIALFCVGFLYWYLLVLSKLVSFGFGCFGLKVGVNYWNFAR
jgi:hypothetical protein